MKKLFKSLFAVVLCLCFGLTLAGCNPSVVSETSNITEGVVSNGGIVLYYDGWVYIINGTKPVTETNVKAKNVRSGIYRIKAQEDGNPYPTERDPEDGIDSSKVQRVSSNLAGFDDGSIFIFGNFLYYTTPCDSRDRDGTMLSGKTQFRRIDLKNFADQLLYTTKASDDTIDYAYYRQGDDLDLVVYEKNSATLTSMKIGKKVTVNFSKESVTSVILSSRFGDSYGATGKTDNYIFYTLSYDSDSAILKGSRVYKILPDGTDEKKISEGHVVTLLSIEYDYLVYYEEQYGVRTTYAERINDRTTALSYSDEKAISCISTSNAYSEADFVLEEGKLKMMVYSGHWISVVDYDPTNMTEDVQRKIVEFDDAEVIHFIDIYGDYVIYQLTTASDSTSAAKNYIYKVKYRNFGTTENRKIYLSTTKPDAENGRLVPEIYNGYLYCFYTETAYNTTCLYKINLTTPEERDELNDDGTRKQVGEADFVGVNE